MKTQAKCCTVSWKEILISKGLVVLSFREFIRLGSKKEGASCSIIAHFLRYPDREQVFKAALEAQDEIDVKVHADVPNEIQENQKKQWPQLKRAREEGKTAYFSRKEPDKLFIEGRFVASCFFFFFGGS